MEGLKIGAVIKELRGDKGISQETLADVCGVSMQAVSKWENSQSYPDITFLPVLAEYFQVSADYLLNGKEAWGEGIHRGGTWEKEACEGRTDGEGIPGIDGRIADMLKDRTQEDVLYVVQYRNGEILGKEIWDEKRLEKEDAAVKIIFDEEFRKLESGLCVEVWGNAAIESEAEGIVMDIRAGGNVNCNEVKGNVNAGAVVNCGMVQGDVRAGSCVDCSDVGGNAKAGCAIKCKNIYGNAKAGVSITYEAER